MKQVATFAVLGVLAFGALAGGCYTPEARQNTAASRDEDRRVAFDRCRADGRTDCDALLNAPVNSTPPASSPTRTTDGDAVREHERRLAYDRCVSDGGRDCEDILRR